MIAYCVTVLAYVASTPDLRLRCFLSDETDEPGIVIRSNAGMEYKGEKPKPGDSIIRVGESGNRTENFVQFSRHMFDLRSKPLPTGGSVFHNADPTEIANAPWMVEEPNGNRWVAVDIRRTGETEPLPSYVLVRSLPLGEVILSFVWFTLQLGVFVFAAMAYWNRPYDQTSRLFLAMCIRHAGRVRRGFPLVGRERSIVVNVAVFHLRDSRPGGRIALLPGVSPREGNPSRGFRLQRWRAFTRFRSWLFPRSLFCKSTCIATRETRSRSPQFASGLGVFRDGIYLYLLIAALYFVGMLVAVFHSLRRAANPMERGQLRWIWYAGIVASVCVGYTMYLAVFERTEFALGEARVPMFLASLSFMLAYSVGIIRYRLMIVDQIVGRSFLYYLFTATLSVVFGLVVALGTFAPELLNISLTQQQALLVAVMFLVGLLLLLWLRDTVQHEIDRQFFREKYQLDKALERVNRAVGHLGDPETIAGMMVTSCRDILSVRHAALYLRGDSGDAFRLVAVDGTTTSPMQFRLSDAFLEALRGDENTLSVASTAENPPVQDVLHQMRAELVHKLGTEEDVAGLVFLGKKERSTPITAEDLTFLNALGQITNVALHGVKMHHDVARLNEDLRLKMAKIADQKRQIALLQSDLTSSQTAADSPAEEADDFQRDAIKGNSAALRSVLENVRKVARTDATVLIRGESGTGKELLAQVLHENGPRRSGPIVRVHCASLAPTLLESELFGHVKGAFTGANRDRAGRFQLADGGTLFLDEIGEISGETQVKLLRVLQEREFEPVGGTKTCSVNVRVIAATNRDLEQMIAQGEFREDLYYRLNVVSLLLPPLWERIDDIYELALHFLNRSAERVGHRVSFIEDDALAVLERYAWPGNVRELENVIERAVVMCEDNRVTVEDLPADVRQHASVPLRARHGVRPPSSVGRRPAAPEIASSSGERDLLLAALRDSAGNKAEAARQLGLPRSTYYSKLKKYGID